MPIDRSADGDYIVSETGNWNVADNFAKLKIMVPLRNCDVYEDIAIYGFDSFDEELLNIHVTTDELKIRGLQRLTNELIKLCKNARFAMKKDKTKVSLLKYQKDLEKIRDNILPHVCKKKIDHTKGISSLHIYPEIFNKTLEAVSEIKSKINTPLNKNHLIFTDREEFDPHAFKKRLKDRIINQG